MGRKWDKIASGSEKKRKKGRSAFYIKKEEDTDKKHKFYARKILEQTQHFY